MSPAGAPLPDAAAINFSPGKTRSNNVIVPLGPSGDIAVHAGIGPGLHLDFNLDVVGYCQQRLEVATQRNARFGLFGRKSGMNGE